MNDNGLMQFAMKMMQSNPNAMNSPMGQQFMQILQSGDQNAGQQLANNICSTYGISKEQAVQQSRNYFHI